MKYFNRVDCLRLAGNVQLLMPVQFYAILLRLHLCQSLLFQILQVDVKEYFFKIPKLAVVSALLRSCSFDIFFLFYYYKFCAVLLYAMWTSCFI